MAEPWTTAAHRLFKKHNIRTVGYVPDAGLTELIKSCHADNDIKSVVMTTEEEGIGLSSGAWLGGEKAAVLMQSSGVGNTVNAIASTKLNRSDVLNKLMEVRGNALAIAGLGSPVWDLAASDHQPENFYNWGGMGCAISMGLGCALAQPKRNIWVITGDGEALMGVGSFATVANQRPDNLVIIILDNEHYGETGMQKTHTSGGTDLAAMAAGAGIPTTMTVHSDEDLNNLINALKTSPLPLVASIKVENTKPKLVLPSRDGVYIKTRFRQAVLGSTAALHVT